MANFAIDRKVRREPSENKQQFFTRLHIAKELLQPKYFYLKYFYLKECYKFTLQK